LQRKLATKLLASTLITAPEASPGEFSGYE
jgi:hypothetical protein